VTPFPAYQGSRNLRRPNIQPSDCWRFLAPFVAEKFPVLFIYVLVLATGGKREFEFKCANTDFSLLGRMKHVHIIVLEHLITILDRGSPHPGTVLRDVVQSQESGIPVEIDAKVLATDPNFLPFNS